MMIARPIAPRGFTLLIAVILASVLLSVATSLLDIAYKQTVLASTNRQSATAFYQADSGLECALYWDRQDLFNYASEPNDTGSLMLSCEGQSFNYHPLSYTPGQDRWTTFSVLCGPKVGDGVNAEVTVVKHSSGATDIYSNGYNTCVANDTRRIQRGLDAKY